MLVLPDPWALGRSFNTFPFHCWRTVPALPDHHLLVRKGPPMGPGPCPTHHPFHCWAYFRTCSVLTLLTFMTGDGPYTGGRRYTCPSPVSLLAESCARNCRHVSQRESSISQNRRKDTRLAMTF